MRVLAWRDFIAGPRFSRPSAVTVGVFDGVHRGHQALLRRIAAQGLDPVVVSFRQNPRLLFDRASYPGDISSLGQKLSLFESLGAACTILIDFSRDFSRLSGREFIDFLAAYGNMAYIAVGVHFRCGHGLDADAAFVKRISERNGASAELVEPVREGGGPISSSRIRAAIRAGDLADAEACMGRAFTLECGPGRVVPADGAYRAVVAGREAEINIINGTIMLPASVDAARVTHIQFLKNRE
jgi:riboflavin kinase/FMN adenylyltransferase